jgi:hypothetical protein
MGKFLNQWNDPGYQPARIGTQPSTRTSSSARLIAIYNMAATLRTFQGAVRRRAVRTGSGQATPRKIRTRSGSLAVIWGATINAEDYTSDTSAHTKGAQVIWPNWWATHKAHMQNELSSGYNVHSTGQEKVGNKYCNRLFNELNVQSGSFSARPESANSARTHPRTHPEKICKTRKCTNSRARAKFPTRTRGAATL